MSDTNRNARTGVKGDKPTPTTNGQTPPSGDAVTARQPRRGAYEPAPGATNGTSPTNGTNGTKPAANGSKPAARKPMRGGLSADEYARTTAAATDTTSVIPVVKDDPAPTPAVEEPVKRQRKSSKSRVSFVTDGPAEQPAVATPATAAPAPTTETAVVAAERPASVRQASLRLAYVDPWSVTRLAFVVSVALMIVAVVAAIVFWVVLAITGVWDNINDSVKNVLSDDSGGFNVGDYLGFWRLIGFALMSSALNVVFMTALATISAHLYNLAAQIMGGIKVSFTEEK